MIDRDRRPKELQLKETLQIQTAVEELRNWDIGLEVAGFTTLKKRWSAADRGQARVRGNS